MENGKRLCDNLSLNGNFSLADLPKTVEVFGAEVILFCELCYSCPKHAYETILR